MQLRVATDPSWVDEVMADFDRFLVDHAACERKASATGMAFVVRYPDRVEILDELIAFAREELEHFHEVVQLLLSRGLRLAPDERDPYLAGLLPWVRGGRDERFLDRLVMASVVEARGCERFGLVHDALPQGALKEFYADVVRAEARHAGLFIRLARTYFDADTIEARTDSLLEHEATVLSSLALRAALH